MNWQTNNAASPAWWSDALTDFARGLGFERLTDKTASVHNFLVGDNRYLLDVECAADEIVLAVFREVPAQQVEDVLLSLLRACNFERYLPFLVQIGLQGSDTIVMAVHLDKANAGQMLGAFEFICKLYADHGLQ